MSGLLGVESPFQVIARIQGLEPSSLEGPGEEMPYLPFFPRKKS